MSQDGRTHRFEWGKGQAPVVLRPDGGAVRLGVEGRGRVKQVQYFLAGSIPGHDGLFHGVIASAEGVEPARWSPRPGTSGTLSALVWYEDGTARTSPGGPIAVPMPRDLLCPETILPAPPPIEVVDWGQSAVNWDQNLLLIDVPGETAFVPLTVDPETCRDRRIAGELRFLQSETKRGHAGLGLAIRRFVELGGLPGIEPERFWLARALIEEEAADEVSIVLRLVPRASGDGAVAERRVTAEWDGGRWSVRLVPAASGEEIPGVDGRLGQGERGR